MSKAPHILVVDDHKEIRESVSRFLEKNGMRATAAKDAHDMDAKLALGHFDLIVLDVMMPGESGLSACQRLSADRSLPIILLTALGEETDRIVGLEIGADDYVSKPFNPRELLARIKAILRRTLNEEDDALIRVADLSMDQDTHEVFLGSIPIDLSPTEFKLLRYLMLNPNRVLSKAQILDHVWEIEDRLET